MKLILCASLVSSLSSLADKAHENSLVHMHHEKDVRWT